MIAYLNDFYSHIPCGMWHGMGGHSHSISEFLLTHPVWDVTAYKSRYCGMDKFLLTHPVWDVTVPRRCSEPPYSHFYSHIPCGMWPKSVTAEKVSVNFYSHIPCGMWQIMAVETPRHLAFLLTHPVWDVTYADDIPTITPAISTHTSRVGCDIMRYKMSLTRVISTHTSRVGCDWDLKECDCEVRISTHTSRVGCDRPQKT